MHVLRTIFFNLPALTGSAIALVLAALACGACMRWGGKMLRAILYIVLLLHAAVFPDATLAYVNFPYEGKSVVEGVTLYNATTYLHGEQPYGPPDETPFRSLVYPPVHEMALAAVVSVLGPSLYAARLFSLLCAVGTAVIAGLAVWRHTKNRIATAFGAIFFICCYGVTGHWLEQVRSDALMGFLVLLGLYAAEKPISRGRAPILGGIILLLALYTKQTAIFAPVAVAVALWPGSRRNAITWTAMFGASAIAAFAGMEIWSGGWFSFYILKVPGSVGIELGKFGLASVFFGGTWIIVWGILLGILPAAIRALRKLSDPSNSTEADNEHRTGIVLWTTAFVLAIPLCLLQSVKWGAALNAFAPLAPLIAVLGGIALHRLLSRFEDKAWLRIGILAAAAMQAAMISYRPILPGKADFDSQRRIAQWVRAAPGDVFVSVFSSQAYLNGKAYFGDNVPIGDLAKGGLWQGGELIEKTRRGEFTVMILRPRIEPEDLARAVQEQYVPAERIPMRAAIGGWPYMQVYVPRGMAWRPEFDK